MINLNIDIINYVIGVCINNSVKPRHLVIPPRVYLVIRDSVGDCTRYMGLSIVVDHLLKDTELKVINSIEDEVRMWQLENNNIKTIKEV